MSPPSHVEVWRQPDGQWRWRWIGEQTGDDGEATLVSHRAYDSEEEASSAARAAYPDAEVHTHPAAREVHKRPRLLTRAAIISAFVVTQWVRARRRSRKK